MNIQTENLFFALLRAGLWGTYDGDERLTNDIEWEALLKLAEEQTVSGVVSDGLAMVKKAVPSLEVPANVTRRLMVQTIGIERSNALVDSVVAEVCGILNKAGIRYCLIKGQGTALNYPHPNHRTPGDIDLLLDEENYRLASNLLTPMAEKVLPEDPHKKHLGMMFRDGVEVELHGTARVGFGKKTNKVIDKMQAELLGGSDFRYWDCLGTKVTLPSADFDSVFIFLHFVQHYYHGGLGLRQICDWMMHEYRHEPEFDYGWMLCRIMDLRMLKEWKAFASLAVKRLGMDPRVIAFYDPKRGKYSDIIWDSMKRSGNFGRKMRGHRDPQSEPYLIRKVRSLNGHLSWMGRHFRLNPGNTLRAIAGTLRSGFRGVVNGQ